MIETQSFGLLAWKYLQEKHPLRVLRSAVGFYIGTLRQAEEGFIEPCSRESEEYFENCEQAEDALRTGTWTQREEP